MRRVVVLGLALALSAAMSVIAAGRPAERASLRLTAVQPLVVQGRGFAAAERVRVRISGPAVATRRAVSDAAGTFSVRFDDVVVTRCDLVRVVAIGSAGSQATLKRLPGAACLPA